MTTTFTTVDDYLAAQSDSSRAAVEALRAIVLDAHPHVSEHLKWNSPSFVVDGIDRATVNIDRAGALRLVLHQGAVKPERAGEATVFAGDPLGILTWHSDIRASLPVGGVLRRESAPRTGSPARGCSQPPIPGGPRRSP